MLSCLRGALGTRGLPQHHSTHLEMAISKHTRWRIKSPPHGLFQLFLAKAEEDLLCPVLANPKLVLLSTAYLLHKGLMVKELASKVGDPRVLHPKLRYCNALTPTGLSPPCVTLTLGHWVSGVWLCFEAQTVMIRSPSQWICESSCEQLPPLFITVEIQPVC